jgi:hypothetical protein
MTDERVWRPGRRTVLALMGVALAGGCTSEADRVNRTVFDAVRKDPLYRWSPDWAIRQVDSETPIGGPYPESGPRLRHSVYAQSLPSSAVSDAIAVALAGGWRANADSLGHVKAIEGSNLMLWVTISASTEFQSVDMIFVRQNA